ncbi:MAG: Asp-tRNA(Asn)/Glu-tRNA(Gln) amidotransferase subunit GatA [Pseudomonadota bacterium]
MNDPFAGPVALAAGLRDGTWSAVELTTHYLERAKRLAPLNSLITLCEDSALAEARAADERRASGTAGELTGVPIVHKDLFCTAGTLTSCGSKMLANFVAPYDATVVARLREAGMVMLGKANMDEFAMGSSNENSFYGAVQNPWDVQRVPGGSSGGSAATVAAGIAPIATGTDPGGSIRQPAAFCGVTGLKPTYGRVSRFGMIAFASSLDQGGLLAHSAADIALTLPAMAGFDPQDSTSSERDAADLMATIDRPLRIGLPREYFDGLDGQMAAAIDAVRTQLEQAGHSVTNVSLPHTDLAIPAYYVISGAEASSNLSRYDGVRFGHRCEDPLDLHDLYTRSRSEGFGGEVKRRILTGTYALSVGYYDAYYVKAQKLRRLIQQDFLAAFEGVDALLAPTTPNPAFPLGNLTNDPVAMYQQDVFTVPASLAGLPAASVPCGFIDGLPVGAQLIGPHFGEATLLQLASDYQNASDWHQQHPELAGANP